MKEVITIGKVSIGRGEFRQISVQIARLPSGTMIDMPIFVSRSKTEGPGVLISGGLHGDEINGVEIVRKFLVDGYHKSLLKGTVICIPIINIYGFLNFSRDLPDGKDVNRSFPGKSNGSLASQVAHYLMKEIIPIIDYGVDFHTGGARINNYPQLRAVLSNPKNLELVKAFAPPFIIDSKFRERSLRKEASRLNKNIIVFEGGESLRLTKKAIVEGVEGIQRLLHYLGMLPNAPQQTTPSIIIKRTTWVRAKSAGLFHHLTKTGDLVTRNQKIGVISDPYGSYEITIKSPFKGYIVAINNNPVINPGDPLVHIGSAG